MLRRSATSWGARRSTATKSTFRYGLGQGQAVKSDSVVTEEIVVRQSSTLLSSLFSSAGLRFLSPRGSSCLLRSDRTPAYS